MTRTEIIDAVKAFCERLSQPLPGEEYAAGWTDSRRLDVLRYFQKLEQDLTSGREIPYIPLIRTLDSAGISDGELLEQACRITNEINGKKF